LAHRNPYARPGQLYPLPVAIFGLPFVWTRPEVAGGIFYGISSALIVFGLLRNGYHHLLIFFAYPYWAGLIACQWTPLIMASAFFPYLLPVTMVKPQLGLPVFLTQASRRGILGCIIVGTLSLLVLPKWPLLWIAQLGHYSHFIPLLVWPAGPVLLLAVLRYRDCDAVLLLLAACMPQRWFYDGFLLWLIPKTHREIDGLCQLGPGHLALVSHTSQFHRSWTLDGCLSLFANAFRGATATDTRTGSQSPLVRTQTTCNEDTHKTPRFGYTHGRDEFSSAVPGGRDCALCQVTYDDCYDGGAPDEARFSYSPIPRPVRHDCA
jgi:hypothetical protein